MNNDVVTRLVNAVVQGIIAGAIVAVLLFVVSKLVPGLEIDASLWALIIGVLVALYVFVNGSTTHP